MNLTFIERPEFTKVITAITDDEHFRAFQNELSKAPERWPVVKGTGGLRKARMRLAGRGKSGGARVLYLYFPAHQTVFFYWAYEKGDIENLPKSALNNIRYAVQIIKKYYEDTP
jgi:hypothetical protein